MNKKDGWDSQFRKKRFYERQSLKELKQFLKSNSNFSKKNSRIVIMLDLYGTTNNIDDNKATIFIEQLEKIRKKFWADNGIICISTHEANTKLTRQVLDVISRNIPNTFKIGKCFFFGGVYDYNEDEVELKDFGFNSNKVETFDKYYNSFNINENKWIGIIDDGADENVYKKYQNKQPMLLCRPFQLESEKDNDNFMSLSSTLKGIDGVIACLDTYIKSIEKMTPQMILRKQQEMIYHLSGYELNEKIRNREYEFLVKYFSLGFADFYDYRDTIDLLKLTIFHQDLSKEELENIKKLVILFEKEYQAKKNLDLEKIKEFKKKLHEYCD